MTVCTRYAPTISGQLHIGGLYNALLNYLFAKKNGGLFKLRLDGLDLNPPHDMWQQNIPRDLELFGLYPDETIKASDRLEIYKEVAFDLDKRCDRSYHCNCTVQDLLKRAREDDSKFYHLYRPEKYPPYCKISRIIIRGPESDDNIATDCKVTATHEATNHSASILVARGGYKEYWEPVDVGYIDHPVLPEIEIDLGCEKEVLSVELVWKDRPVLVYEIWAWKGHEWQSLMEVKKSGRHFIDIKQGQPFVPFTGDRCNFATTKTQKIKIKIYSCPIPVDKPYFYDGHCRSLKKKLDLYDKDTVLRLRADRDISPYDTAYWYGRLPNLVLMSPFDDMALGVTHCIRGCDIEPWLALEHQVDFALNTPIREQIIHGLVIDRRGYKYSKWIESTPIRSYLQDGITANKILTYLANKAGLVNTKEVQTPVELVALFDGTIPGHNVVIDEVQMLEELRG